MVVGAAAEHPADRAVLAQAAGQQGEHAQRGGGDQPQRLLWPPPAFLLRLWFWRFFVLLQLLQQFPGQLQQLGLLVWRQRQPRQVLDLVVAQFGVDQDGQFLLVAVGGPIHHQASAGLDANDFHAQSPRERHGWARKSRTTHEHVDLHWFVQVTTR
jgi:hypothetical protein